MDEKIKSDIITHKEFINVLVDRYSEYIDNYAFDELHDKIGHDWEFIAQAKSLYANDIESIKWRGLKFDDPLHIVWIYIVSIIQELDSFDNLFNEFIKRNFKYRYKFSPFADWVINNCSTLELQTIPTWLFYDTIFYCDIHIKAEKLLSNALAGVHLNNHDLYIEDGCTEIELMAVFRASGINHIYLPSTLNKLDLQYWDAHAIYYDGTIDQFLNLMKRSSWKTAAKIHIGSNKPLIPVDIICTDGTIKRNTKIDRYYNIIS